MTRHDQRQVDQLREIEVQRRYTEIAAGSVLVRAGKTVVLCTASIDDKLPPWLEGKGKGWITAEYSMLPGSTSPRKARDRGTKIDGRTTEIQRLIGRSLRAVADLTALGPRQITVDCDVLQADGGTRTLSITGALIALVDALSTIEVFSESGKYPLRDSVAAVSVGVVRGEVVVDLDYQEDSSAWVDMNVVMTGAGRFIEIQGTGEEATFSEDELHRMLAAARGGITTLTSVQREALGNVWPF